MNQFPQMIEKQEYQFTCINDQENSSEHEESPKNMYFQVNEEEFEDMSEDEENKADVASNEGEAEEDNISMASNTENNDHNEKDFQDNFLESSFVTTSAEASNSQSKKSEAEDHADQKTATGGQQFKLKNAKGTLIFDQSTKQKRYLSPFEQFLAEQQELFKKDETRQHDEENSVTMTTTASTQFEQKIGGSE